MPQMRTAVMNYAGMLSAFNPAIQSMPSWEALNRELLGQSDPHMSAEQSGIDAEMETEPFEGAVGGATLTRSKPVSATRRQRLATEPRLEN
jgi:hypothetical protein